MTTITTNKPVTTPVTMAMPSVMATAMNCIRACDPIVRPSPASIISGSWI